MRNIDHTPLRHEELNEKKLVFISFEGFSQAQLSSVLETPPEHEKRKELIHTEPQTKF